MLGSDGSDKWAELIFASVRNEPGTADERLRAIVRAGQIAQAYIGADRDLLNLVFGSGSELMLQHHADANTAVG